MSRVNRNTAILCGLHQFLGPLNRIFAANFAQRLGVTLRHSHVEKHGIQ